MNIDIIEKPKNNIYQNIKIGCSSDIVELKDVQEIRNAIREHLLFIGLDNRNNVRNITLLNIGSSNYVKIDTKEIIRTALLTASDKVILVHNHPSNSLEPSKDDLHFTNITSEILKPFNIKLQDHIIVTSRDYISMEKIKKMDNKSKTKPINNMKKGLLVEENKRLKAEIKELRKELNKTNQLKVISAEYVGSYNDTISYSVELFIDGEKEYIIVEKSNDNKKIKDKWEVFSKLALKKEETNYIIETISKNPPILSMDAPPTIYENSLLKEIEI